MAEESTSFWVRLKQHHIYRVAAWYGATIAVLIQVVARAFPYFGWSAAVPAVIIILIAGFPLAIVLAWILVKPADPASQTRWQRRHWKLGAVVVPVVIAAVVVSGYFAWGFSERHAQHLDAASATAGGIPAKSIAVLPFENLNVDQKDAYFVAGMQDLILTKLADIGDLKVISRTSTTQYASHPGNLKQIGEQLGVATILEGSVQKAGDQVLINVQLIDAQTDNHIWAQSYQRTLDNVFGVEGDVAEQIATALQAKLSPAESTALAAVPTQNRAAYDLFLRAEYQTNKGDTNYDTASMKAAVSLYRQAVEQDPNFALAWARRSYTESQLAWFFGGGEDVKQLNQQARADAEHALQLQPDLAAAQIAIGYTEYWGREDYAAALKAFAAALELKPNDANALAAQGYIERRQGRFDAAIASLQQALTLDPRNSALTDELGNTFMMADRYADAEDVLQRALAIDPDNHNAMRDYSDAILLSTGDIPRALAVVQGDGPALKNQRLTLLTYQRKYRDAFALLDGIPDTPDNFSRNSDFIVKPQLEAGLYQLMGDMAHARPLYAEALSRLQTQSRMQQGINQAIVWSYIAAVQIGLGQTAAGLDAIAKSQTIQGNIEDQVYGPRIMMKNAMGYAQAHRPDLALPLLAKALTNPGIGVSYSPVLLWLDPSWDPIRHDPRFQALIEKYAKYKPAVIYAQAPAASSS